MLLLIVGVELAGNNDIQTVYFQEPDFNDVDKEFLKLRGGTVTESPDSQAKINQHTGRTFRYIPNYGGKSPLSSLDACQGRLPIFLGNNLFLDKTGLAE